MSTRTPLLPLVRRFFETDLAEAARSLETMDEEEAVQILTALPANLSAQAFPLLPIGTSASLLKNLPRELFKQIIEILEPHQAAAIFTSLPQESKEQFIEVLSEKTKRQIQELLLFPAGSAGRLMSPDFIAFHTEVKVKDAINKIRQLSRSKAPNSYVYVIDDENKLVGILNMRDLLWAQSDMRLELVMRRDVFSVSAFADKSEVAKELTRQKYFAAPVVDAEQRLIGVLKTDQITDEIQSEASEDILLMFGAGGDERVFSTFGFAVKKRLPWLYVNLATAFLASGVVGLFQGIISKLTVLAVFLPVVAGQGGNAGAQSLAVIMRGLVMREVAPDKVWKSVLKEVAVGAFNGFMVGVVTAAIVWMWHGNPYLGLVIGLAMIFNLIAAGFAGAAIPLVLKALGFDPAQSSSIILTTVTDVVGFFAFLGLAVLMQNHLM